MRDWKRTLVMVGLYLLEIFLSHPSCEIVFPFFLFLVVCTLELSFMCFMDVYVSMESTCVVFYVPM